MRLSYPSPLLPPKDISSVLMIVSAIAIMAAGVAACLSASVIVLLLMVCCAMKLSLIAKMAR